MGYLIALIIVGVIIIAVVKSKKKKKEKAAFKQFLVSSVENKKNDKEFFLSFYKQALAEVNLTEENLELLCKQIPHCKSEFSMACQKLTEIGKSNVCLMRDENVGADLSDEKITQDIVQALPCLARFYKERDRLYKTIYKEILNDKIAKKVNIWFLVFRTAFEDEDRNYYIGLVDGIFQAEINSFICNYLKLEKEIDVRKSTDQRVVRLVEYADEIIKSEELLLKYLEIFVAQLKAIGNKYTDEGIDLYQYFSETENEVKKVLPWFSIKAFKLPSSCLELEEESEQECLRVLELYTSGKMKGRYSKFAEKLC